MPRAAPLLAAVPLALALAAAAACRDRSRPREPGAPGAAGEAAVIGPAQLDLRLWTRMDPAAFGCWMEKALGHRDARWNCSSAYEGDADPCGDPARFREGPSLPTALAPQVHAWLTRVDLAWEGGALQSAKFVFGRGVAPAEMARILGAEAVLADAASAGPGDCGGPCYVVTMFEPGEPECDEDEEASEDLGAR